LYTFISLEEINEIVEFSKTNPEKRLVQKKLAYELCKMIHGEDSTQKVINASSLIF
jgi:tyrosyl-tRNA synthetase